MRSKCFVFNVAMGRFWFIAVAAIKRSARSICFLFRLSAVFKNMAASTHFSSKGIIEIIDNILFQNSIWFGVAPEYSSYFVMVEMTNSYP